MRTVFSTYFCHVSVITSCLSCWVKISSVIRKLAFRDKFLSTFCSWKKNPRKSNSSNAWLQRQGQKHRKLSQCLYCVCLVQNLNPVWDSFIYDYCKINGWISIHFQILNKKVTTCSMLIFYLKILYVLSTQGEWIHELHFQLKQLKS